MFDLSFGHQRLLVDGNLSDAFFHSQLGTFAQLVSQCYVLSHNLHIANSKPVLNNFCNDELYDLASIISKFDARRKNTYPHTIRNTQTKTSSYCWTELLVLRDLIALLVGALRRAAAAAARNKIRTWNEIKGLKQKKWNRKKLGILSQLILNYL